MSGTSSKLGAKGNIGVDYNATAVKLTIANGVLTITAGSGEIFTAGSATAATAVTGTTKAISVADGFTAYTIVENSDTAPADILTISEDAAVAGNIANDVIVTVNSNGEATALYVLNTLA